MCACARALAISNFGCSLLYEIKIFIQMKTLRILQPVYFSTRRTINLILFWSELHATTYWIALRSDDIWQSYSLKSLRSLCVINSAVVVEISRRSGDQ